MAEIQALFVPPEGVTKITGVPNYDGIWYEYLGEEEVGGGTDPISGDTIPGTVVSKIGSKLQAVDDGDPTTPVKYVKYSGKDEDYKPFLKDESYTDNVQKFIVDGKFKGHPTDPEE